jgi:hypothetical protein
MQLWHGLEKGGAILSLRFQRMEQQLFGGAGLVEEVRQMAKGGSLRGQNALLTLG